MYLADSGFEVLPKNYSQAAVLTKAKKLETGYYQDHPMLEQIWGTLVANTASEKITANAIEKAIDPDYDEKQSLRLPKRLLARAKIQARLRGITVEEYLDELMDADADEGCIVAPETAIPVAPEMSQIIDELELQWLEPKSEQITTTPISKFDKEPSFWISIAAFISRLRTNPQRVSP
jgi:predicted DNA binding CopG/RHH family protein